MAPCGEAGTITVAHSDPPAASPHPENSQSRIPAGKGQQPSIEGVIRFCSQSFKVLFAGVKLGRERRSVIHSSPYPGFPAPDPDKKKFNWCLVTPIDRFEDRRSRMPTILRAGPYRFFFYAGDAESLLTYTSSAMTRLLNSGLSR